MEKTVIGSNAYISIPGYDRIPAKIDTGADSTAIWATGINMTEDGMLEYKLFGQNSPYYDGKIIRTNKYKIVATRSSHGDRKIFYRVTMPITMHGETIDTLVTLSSRGRNTFPVLIGKRTLEGKFLVDVSIKEVRIRRKSRSHKNLNAELKENPYKFHKKYFKSKNGK